MTFLVQHTGAATTPVVLCRAAKLISLELWGNYQWCYKCLSGCLNDVKCLTDQLISLGPHCLRRLESSHRNSFRERPGAHPDLTISTGTGSSSLLFGIRQRATAKLASYKSARFGISRGISNQPAIYSGILPDSGWWTVPRKTRAPQGIGSLPSLRRCPLQVHGWEFRISGGSRSSPISK